MKIKEIFKTIQCEGKLIGTVSVLIRFSGCNLNCRWCDEKASSNFNNGIDYSCLELINNIEQYNCKNIIITGGEPLLNGEIEELTSLLKEKDYYITIETNGTIKRNVKADLISVSPKLSNSIHEEESFSNYRYKLINFDALNYFIKNYNYQVKFVIEKEEDLIEVKSILDKLDYYNTKDVLIMPLASSRKQLYDIQKKIVNLCIKYNYRYANRLQLQIWGKGKEKISVKDNVSH